MKALGLGVILLSLTGCAAVKGGLGDLPPVDIVCKGRATIMGGPYAITADCGEGFEYRRGGEK